MSEEKKRSAKELLDELLARQAQERRDVATVVLGSIIDKTVERTEAWAKTWGYPLLKDTEGLSVHAARVFEVLRQTDFGCYTMQVRELCSALIGEKFPMADARGAQIDYVRGVVVVPLKVQDGAHNYELDKPAIMICTGGGNCYSEKHLSSGTGNCLTNKQRFLRPATRDEITELLGALSGSKDGKVLDFMLGLEND